MKSFQNYLPSFIIRKREGAVFNYVYRFVMDRVGPEVSEAGRSQNCLSGLTGSEDNSANQVLCKAGMRTVNSVVTANIQYENGDSKKEMWIMWIVNPSKE